jgi:hypothetical protein
MFFYLIAGQVLKPTIKAGYRARKGREHGIKIKKKTHVFLMFKCAQAIVLPTAHTTITVTFPRETREGWTLLTVETEMNGNSKGTNVPWLAQWARLSGTRDSYAALAALVRSVQSFFFFSSYTTYSIYDPHCPATWAGSRAGTPVSACASPTFSISS